jgi:hypothetical protein
MLAKIIYDRCYSDMYLLAVKTTYACEGAELITLQGHRNARTCPGLFPYWKGQELFTSGWF